MAAFLKRQGYNAGRKKVQGLMRKMGIEALYTRPRTTKRNKGHKAYPYLLRGIEICPTRSDAQISHISLFQEDICI